MALYVSHFSILNYWGSYLFIKLKKTVWLVWKHVHDGISGLKGSYDTWNLRFLKNTSCSKMFAIVTKVKELFISNSNILLLFSSLFENLTGVLIINIVMRWLVKMWQYKIIVFKMIITLTKWLCLYNDKFIYIFTTTAVLFWY